MNLGTIAKLAGVSIATVSKAFSGSSEISELTKNKIFDIAKQNGCFDKYNKNKYPKKIIAVICPEVQSNYYAAMLTKLEHEISISGGMMTVSLSAFKPEKEEELFLYYSFYCKADGIIIINPHKKINNSINIPAVAIGPTVNSANIDTIKIDTESSIQKAVSFLKDNGHIKVGFVGEKLTMSKLEGFKNAMRKSGLSVMEKWIKVSEARFEVAGRSAMDEWFKENDTPSAIFAAYDYIALGVIQSIRQHGMHVPENFSVIGMDDISIVPYLDTPLSSIKTHTDDVCRIAAELVMKKIENQYYSARQDITVATDFVVRKSAGRVPESAR